MGNGVEASSNYSLSIDKNSSTTVTFIVAGSAKDKNEAIKTYNILAKNHVKLLEEKKNNNVKNIIIYIFDYQLYCMFKHINIKGFNSCTPQFI